MWLINLVENNNGSREPLIQWDSNVAPRGYALCSDEFYDLFYSITEAPGFVNIVVEDDTVKEMTINQKAVDEYLAQPKQEESVITDPIEQLEEENKRLNETLQSQAEQIALLEGCVIELAQQLYS